jgi:hypothetical protein
MANGLAGKAEDGGPGSSVVTGSVPVVTVECISPPLMVTPLELKASPNPDRLTCWAKNGEGADTDPSVEAQA